MMRILSLFLALLCFDMSAALAAVLSQEEQGRLVWILERGQLLFDLDRAAWVGTDDLRARMPDARNAGLRGYIVEREGPAFIVTFFGGPEDAPIAFYRGRVENHEVVGREVYPAAGRPPLTAMQRRLAGVHRMASQLHPRRCSDQRFNATIVPPATPDGPIDLYLLAPQVEQDAYPLGGHYRYTIAADGTVQSTREFMRTCMTFDARPERNGNRPEAMMVTHLLDPTPTEIHVFSSLASRLPIYVAAGDRVWAVEGAQIRLIDSPEDRRPR